MQRLEEIVGEPLLAPQGRGRGADAGRRGSGRPCPPHSGGAPRGLAGAQGRARRRQRVAIGTTQDFADSGLPELLRAFAASHPRVRIELRVGRSAELTEALQAGALDLAITMRQAPAPDRSRRAQRADALALLAKGAGGAPRRIAAGAARPALRLSRSGARRARCRRPPLPHRRRQRQPCRPAHGRQCRHRADAAHARFAHSGIVEAPRDMPCRRCRSPNSPSGCGRRRAGRPPTSRNCCTTVWPA